MIGQSLVLTFRNFLLSAKSETRSIYSFNFFRFLFIFCFFEPTSLYEKVPLVGIERSGDMLSSDVGASLVSNTPLLVEGISWSLDFLFFSLGVALFSISKNLW